MDVDLKLMEAKLGSEESWDELIIRRLLVGPRTDFLISRWTARKGSANRVYEILSAHEAAFVPAWVTAKRDTRKRIAEKKITYGVIKYQPNFNAEDEALIGVLVPPNWLLHEFRSVPANLTTEGNRAR